MRYALGTFRWAVTDFGAESSIAACSDVLGPFLHWAVGLPESESPLVNHDSLLFPNIIYIPGWNHMWANLLKSSMESTPFWPQRLSRLRALCKFLKIDDYRTTWSRTLIRAGLRDQGQEVAKPFRASFLNWRWETLATVLAEVSRLRHILQDFFMPELFSNMEDGALLSEVVAATRDHEFLAWSARAAEAAGLVEEIRLWGTWCPCHKSDDKSACHRRGRRLHQAAQEVDHFCDRMSALRRRCTLELCSGFESVMQEIAHLCNSLMSAARLRFSWLRELPYALHSVCDQQCAAAILEKWDAVAPERHHKATASLVEKHFDEIHAVAQGAIASESLRKLQDMMRLVPLSEASIEGYHAEVSFEHRRAHASRLPWIFSRLRCGSNVRSVRAWLSKVSGAEIVAYEWNRYKRIVKHTHSERGAAMTQK